MRIKEQYKVREMAGEYVVIMQGRFGSDLTRIISLNESALYLWRAIEGRDFDIETLTDLLVENYGIEPQKARADASHWVQKLQECNLLE